MSDVVPTPPSCYLFKIKKVKKIKFLLFCKRFSALGGRGLRPFFECSSSHDTIHNTDIWHLDTRFLLNHEVKNVNDSCSSSSCTRTTSLNLECCTHIILAKEMRLLAKRILTIIFYYLAFCNEKTLQYRSEHFQSATTYIYFYCLNNMQSKRRAAFNELYIRFTTLLLYNAGD